MNRNSEAKARSETVRAVIGIFLLMLVPRYSLHGQSISKSSTDEGVVLEVAIAPEQDERFQKAVFAGWISDPQRPVKAVIIHQHGCTNASPESHPPITRDLHWRALARKHSCLLIAPMYHVVGECSNWNDPESGSERALFTALADFADQLGRPEIKDLPWVLWGHSGGSSWSAQMMVRHPNRVLAASFRGGCSKQFGAPEFRAKFGPVAKNLPMLFIWGKRESVPTSSHFVSWDPMNTMYRELRTQGGRVCLVIDPLSEHGCDNSRLMSIPFFDAVLSNEASQGVLVDIQSQAIKKANATNQVEPGLTWLPNEKLAAHWKEYSASGTLTPKQPMLRAPVIGVSRPSNGTVCITWSISPALDGGLRAVRIYRDDKLWKQIGVKPQAFLATSRDSTPEGLRAAEFTDKTTEKHSYSVAYLDAAGNESPRSETVHAK